MPKPKVCEAIEKAVQDETDGVRMYNSLAARVKGRFKCRFKRQARDEQRHHDNDVKTSEALGCRD
jgi:rubrerythrin